VDDWSDILLGPCYDEFARPAVLTLVAGAFDIAAIDDTAGVLLPAGGIGIETLSPVARVRAADLLGLGVTMAQLDNQALALNGKNWTITAHRMKPSPSGESDGEVILLLERASLIAAIGMAAGVASDLGIGASV